MSTSIDGIQGVEIVITVKQGEEFKHKLIIKDKAGVSVPLPADINITLSKAGCTNVLIHLGAGITAITNDTITFDRTIDFTEGSWTIDAPISGDGYPTFKIYGNWIVT